MKLVSLNIWGGRAHDALVTFIEGHKGSTDIFCFQEVWTSDRADVVESNGTRIHILEELSAQLKDFSAYFYPVQEHFDLEGRTNLDMRLGSAIFVRRSIDVLSSGEVFTYKERNTAEGDDWATVPTNFVYVRVPFKESTLSVLDFHGIAFPADKLDTPERLEQSRRIRKFVRNEEGEVVLCGDFNLMPETQSITMLEDGMENLIKTHGVTMTRSTINPYYGTPEQQNFADYTFVSKGIRVSSFNVPADCVASDHLPMIVEFE